MYVQDSVLRDVDDRLRNDLAVANDDHDVRSELLEESYVFRAAYSFGLIDGNAEFAGCLFDRGLGQGIASSFGTIRLCENSGDLMPGRS